VIDVIKELEEYGVEVTVVDPAADKEDLWNEYRITLSDIKEVKGIDAVIFAVPHEEFKSIHLDDIKQMFESEEYNNSEVMKEVAATSEFNMEVDRKDCVLVDLKGIFNRKEAEVEGFSY